MNKKRAEKLKGLPNKRPRAREVTVAAKNYEVTRKMQRDLQPYDGSTEQLAHRGITG